MTTKPSDQAEPPYRTEPSDQAEPSRPADPAHPVDSTDAPDPDTGTETEVPVEHGGQVLLVRRRRVPALGFWVLLAVAIPFVIGMIIAWSVGLRSLTQILYFGVTAGILGGAPLALIAAVIDQVLDRRRRRR